MDTDEHETEQQETGTDDPGWVLHDTVVEGEYAERWLYHYADLTVVDEEGTPYEPDTDGVLAPVDDLDDLDDRDETWDEPRDEPADAEPVAEEPTYDPEPDPEPAYEPTPADEAEWDREPAYAVPDRGLDLSRLPARSVVLGALVVSALLTIGLLAVVVTRWGGSSDPVDTATPASRLQLPAAVPPDTEYVRSEVLPTGDIRVDHWLASTRPIPRIVLTPPAVPGAARVTARDVRVETADGDREGAATVAGSPETYALDDAEELHVSYVLSGTVTRSGAGSDRALARATSLDLGYPGARVPRTVVLQGGRLLSAACTADAAAEPRPCGQAEGRSWRVRLEPAERDDLVLAQLDLSPA